MDGLLLLGITGSAAAIETFAVGSEVYRLVIIDDMASMDVVSGLVWVF